MTVWDGELKRIQPSVNKLSEAKLSDQEALKYISKNGTKHALSYRVGFILQSFAPLFQEINWEHSSESSKEMINRIKQFPQLPKMTVEAPKSCFSLVC